MLGHGWDRSPDSGGPQLRDPPPVCQFLHPRGLAGSLWQEGSPGLAQGQDQAVLEATCHRWRTKEKSPPGPQMGRMKALSDPR